MQFNKKQQYEFLAISWTELEEGENGVVACPRALLVSPVVRYSEELNAVGLIDDIQIDIALDIQTGIKTPYALTIPDGIDVPALTKQARAMLDGVTSKRYTISGFNSHFIEDENEEVQPVNHDTL